MAKDGGIIKIIKMCVARRYGSEHYYCVFDEIPEITYEKIGSDYVGSVIDEDNNIIFSELLHWQRWGNAFAGRELSLKMKDGSITKIKDHWFYCGSYKEHGEFISIGAKTLEGLQDCYVYQGMNINKRTFEKMLDDYYSREKEYEYYEIEKWCQLQYKWHPVTIDGKKYPLMVNEKGDFCQRESKERIYPRINKRIGRFKYAEKTDKEFKLCLFDYSYKDGDRLIKIQRKMLDVLMESLPITDEDIIKNCKLYQ